MNRIIEKAEGFYAVVEGRWVGTWRSKREAEAGMQVELRREEAKRQRQADTGRLYAMRTKPEYWFQKLQNGSDLQAVTEYLSIAATGEELLALLTAVRLDQMNKDAQSNR